MKIRITPILLIISIILAGCSGAISINKTDKGYEYIKNAKIQPDKAIKLAEPYLDKIFEIRSKNRDWPSVKERQPIIHIVLKGNYYYVTKENYPAKDIYFYMRNAVKIHKNRGKIIIKTSE